MGVVVPEAGRAGEDGACSAAGVWEVEFGVKKKKETGRVGVVVVAVSPSGPGAEKPSQARIRPRRLRRSPGRPPTPPAAALAFFLAAASLFCLLSSAISAPGPATSTRQAARGEGRAEAPPAAGPATATPLLRTRARGGRRGGRAPAGGAELPLGQWAGGRRGGPALAAGEAGLQTRPAALRRRGGQAHAPLLLAAVNGRPSLGFFALF